MDIILPVAGVGRRCRPLTHTRPKPLLPVAGGPLLGHVLDRLLRLEPDRLVFVTGYRGDEIETWVRARHPDRDCRFARQERLLGQSHAVLLAEGLVGRGALVVFPDMLFELPPSPLPAPGLDGAVYTARVADRANFAIARLARDGTVSGIEEKPETPVVGEAVVGMYAFRDMPRLFEAIRRQMDGGRRVNGEYALADAIGLMVADGDRFGTIGLDDWIGAGSNAGLLAANRWLLARQAHGSVPRPGCIIVPPCEIDPTAILERSIVGPFATVGAGAAVRDSVVRDSIVGAGAMVVSAVLDGCLIGDRAAVRGRPAALTLGDDGKA